jgi:hypothetical protein
LIRLGSNRAHACSLQLATGRHRYRLVRLPAHPSRIRLDNAGSGAA